jgi:uncharacterized protein
VSREPGARDAEEMLAGLERRITEMDGAVVAFSGGVDSSVVAAAAWRALRERAVAVTAVSPALATGELDQARAVAAAIGIAHRTVETAEMARAGYQLNGRDRCYHCKSELYDVLAALAGEDTVVLSGANADDSGDWRPGLVAAAEHAVRSPLMEAGLGKAEVRAIARALGLPSADKPASPCLASRLPYGTPVTAEALARVDSAERELKQLGYRILRVRHLGELGRVELGADELLRADTPAGRREIKRAVAAAGYTRVEVAAKAFRSGSLNAVLDTDARRPSQEGER